MSFLGGHFTCVVTTHCWGARVTVPGGDSWERVSGFPSTFSSVPFCFAHFTWYLLTVVDHSHEQDCMLSPVSCPSKSLNLGEVSGMRNIHMSLN